MKKRTKKKEEIKNTIFRKKFNLTPMKHQKKNGRATMMVYEHDEVDRKSNSENNLQSENKKSRQKATWTKEVKTAIVKGRQ